MTSTTPSVVTINETEIQPIVLRDQRVLTLAMIDQIHQRPAGTAGRNFRENKARLTEGKHYFRICADEIRRHKIIEISSRAREAVIFMTEYGYLLLVKSLTDDLAWRIQEELVECYFRAGSQSVVGESCDTLTPSEQQTLSEIAHKKAEPYGKSQGKALAEIWSRLHHKFRVAKYSQLPRTQLTEAIVFITSMQVRMAEQAPERISEKQLQQLLLAAQVVTSHGVLRGGQSANQWLHNRMRTEFNLRHLEDLPPARLPEALAIIAELAQLADKLSALVMGVREAFERDVIGAGHPWTPWVTRQLGGAHLIPVNPDWRALGQVLLQQKLMASS